MWALTRAGAALLVSLFALFASPAWAEKRVALIVGNAAYQNAAALTNPRNDAEDIAAALGDLGFQVILGTDLNQQALAQKVHEFAKALDGADVGLFFYAGHGLQVKGINYLVATDAKLEAERDLDFEAVRVEFVLSQMEREAKTNLVFLDACRNNPLARNLARTMGTRGVDENNGLAPIKSGLGTFIAFSTQPGNVASDGEGRNSPFTAALKKHIAEPGVAISDLLIDVRKDVVEETRGAQVPWDNSALEGRFYFRATPATEVPSTATVEPSKAPAPPVYGPDPQLELGFWNTVKDSNDPAELQAYLDHYPKGRELIIPAHQKLLAVLATMKSDSVRLLTNTRGLPWTQNGFRASWSGALEPPQQTTGTLPRPHRLWPIKRAGLVFHGLRRSAVVMLLEAGCTDAEVAAITGQSRQMIEHYSRQVNQKRLAASAILKWENAE